MFKYLLFMCCISLVTFAKDQKKSPKNGRYIASIDYQEHENIRQEHIKKESNKPYVKNYDLYKFTNNQNSSVSSSVYHTDGESAVFGFKFESPF